MSGKKKKEIYFVKRDGQAHVLSKVNEDDPTTPVTVHRVEGMACDCKGFQYRGSCKHIELVREGLHGKPVTLAEAREIVSSLLCWFREVFRSADLADDPYDRNSEGMVTCATIILRDIIVKSDLFTPGIWESCVHDGGLKIRMIVK